MLLNFFLESSADLEILVVSLLFFMELNLALWSEILLESRRTWGVLSPKFSGGCLLGEFIGVNLVDFEKLVREKEFLEFLELSEPSVISEFSGIFECGPL